MMVWTSLLLAFAAFAAIAASMERHNDQFGTQTLAASQLNMWRMGGYALLGISLLPCLQRWNTSLAIAAWAGSLTFAAVALGLTLTYAPHKAKHMAFATAALGMLAWLIQTIG